MPSIARAAWRTRLRGWGSEPVDAAPGYDLLMPVPGDLPVFLRIALAVCRLQYPEHRRETFIIPDLLTADMRRIHAEASAHWPGTIRLLSLPIPERYVLPRLGDPGRNHAYQIIAGVKASRSTHVVLHDADLFLPSPAAHRTQYLRSVEQDLSVLGVEQAWDPWFAARGRTLAATWEMVARVDWLRTHPPHRLMGHDGKVEGERHTFDTTFWAQLHSSPAEISVMEPVGEFVHFNYVISTYRNFMRTTGPFHDKNFRLLLIRAFSDLFDRDAVIAGLPDLPALKRGLQDEKARVFYQPGDRDVYLAFRRKFRLILSGPWSEGAGEGLADTYLTPFDWYFDVPATH